ncbi:MAG TPA: tRNA (adenosine(37)-N6)-threonylcarbamoyltransferase complex transferase subunit TsaD [Phycisphaerales bacterium]|nr:tRNA (adenosine(37)-N6)-threonylcarbamoyltransferase complex transferase subunit TsaD [Phycisphaerales bacterium]
MEPDRLILGIETSCDETAAAVVRGGREVLSNVIASQHDLHAEYRGVVPEIASRAHAERLLPVVERALGEAGVEMEDLDAIAVGNRPGLIGSLLVGVAGAKALAWTLGIPIIGVDHVRAHLVAGLLRRGTAPASTPVEVEPFPSVGLVVSGGHTSLYLCDSPTGARRIGATIDDAVGEAYDKVAAILGLAFPGGPNLDRLARTGRVQAPGFPIARIAPDSLDFSFSGLKTAALYALRGVPETERHRAKREARGESPPPLMSPADVAATFQEAAIGAVMLKLGRALEMHPGCRAVLVGGGVSANSLLRERLASLAAEREIEVRVPAMEYCLDNGAMIAALGHDLLVERAWRGDDLAMTASPSSAF